MSVSELYEVPDSWKWTTLGEIGEVITGNTPPKKNLANYGEYIPFVKPPELNDNELLNAKDSLSEEGAIIGRTLPPCSVLVSCIGILGKTGFNKVPVAFNQQINSVIFPKNVESKYGFYYCQTLKKWLYGVSSATTLPIVNKSKFQLAPIPIPPLNEQKRIVNKIEELFTKLDAGIQELTLAKEKLKIYRQSVLKHAFEGKLTEEWREAHKDEIIDASIILKRIEKDLKEKLGKKYKSFPPSNVKELPILPAEWKWATFSQIGDLISGQHIKTQDYNQDSDGMPYLTGPADFGFKYPLISKWTPKPKAKALKDDVMITVKGAGIGKVNVLDIEEAAISRQLMSIRASDFDQNFIYYYIKSNFYYFQKLGSSSTVPGINRDQILKSVIPVPPLDEQKEIGNEISKIFSLIENMESNMDHGFIQSNRLRQSILKKAFKGQLVPQDPNDEPAQKLLQRIKAQKEKQKPQRKSKQKRRVK